MSQAQSEYIWHFTEEIWDTFDVTWDSPVFISYKKETQSTLFTSGEYIILANSEPYQNVKKPTGVQEVFNDSGIGTILKKEFRYSVDSVTFSEFQELNTENLESLGPFENVWFQFRYILLSGGPVTIQKVTLLFEAIPSDPYNGYVAPAIQDESRVYAFPVTYKSNFVWEPYKMNRAVRLYKDLNLMVNNLFGHDTTYYRALPQGRSKDVFLMEYSLYEHDEGKCVKVVVPNNEFPDNKLNMGPFGVDFELPFEVQIDKDYFQKIFGDGSGPQKRDVLYFPRTNRIYEVSSSYLFRDFMNEPLYFKVTLIKWLPKSNAEQSETLNALEDYTVSAGKLFGEIKEEEEIKTTNPQQYNVARVKEDPVRSSVSPLQEIGNENVLNYYTLIAEYFYKLESSTTAKRLVADINTEFLKKDVSYFARFSPSSSQSDIQWYYSMKKMKYLGKNEQGLAIFEYSAGNSQVESLYNASQIFTSGSLFRLYAEEYGESNNSDPVASCDTLTSYFNKSRVVKYKAMNSFPSAEDRSYSAWFKTKTNTSSKTKVTSFSFDIYTREITLELEKPVLYFVRDLISLTRSSGSDFDIFGEVTEIISQTSYRIRVDQEIIDYVQGNFSTWTSYNDLQSQKTFSRVFLSSIDNSKGIKIELYGNRHFKITMNGDYKYFSIPGNSLGIENEKWHGIFINFGNIFKQLTLNLWKRQWDPVSNVPATTELKLIYNKTVPLLQEDRSSNSEFFLEPSYMDLTNIRWFNRVAETDKQVFILNQNIVKDAQWAIIIDNALPQSKLPYIGYTR